MLQNGVKNEVLSEINNTFMLLISDVAVIYHVDVLVTPWCPGQFENVIYRFIPYQSTLSNRRTSPFGGSGICQACQVFCTSYIQHHRMKTEPEKKCIS